MFLVNKRDWDHIPVIILKNLNTLIPYPHFKMEGTHLILKKIHFYKKRLFDKNRSKRCLFEHASRQILKEIYSFPMRENLVLVPSIMFWSGIKDYNCIINPLRSKPWQWLKKQTLLLWIFCLSDSIFKNAAFTKTELC